MQKILEVWERLKQYELDCLCLQEIDVESAITCFEKDFKVIVNWDTKSNNKIGIAMLPKQSIKIEDKIIGENGRIIGIKIKTYRFGISIPSLDPYLKRTGNNFSLKFYVIT